MKTYPIEIVSGMTIQLTGEQVADLHDRLTTLYNENYQEIHQEIPGMEGTLEALNSIGL